MSSTKPDDPISKVTFSPVSDGKIDALIVTIKTVKPEGQEFLQIPGRNSYRAMETPKRSSSSDVKKKSRSTRASTSKSTATDKSKNSSSQTSVELPVPSTSVELPVQSTSAAAQPSPCLKHAAENISRKASQIPAEKVSLCNNCSKSMLSYIFVVQDFLESLAKEICGNADAHNCVQCMRQETRRSLSSSTQVSAATKEERRSSSKSGGKSGHKSEEAKSESSGAASHSKDSPREARRYEESSEVLIKRTISERRHGTSQNPSGEGLGTSEHQDYGRHQQEPNREGGQQQQDIHSKGGDSDRHQGHSGGDNHPGGHHDANVHGHHVDQGNHGTQHGHQTDHGHHGTQHGHQTDHGHHGTQHGHQTDHGHHGTQHGHQTDHGHHGTQHGHQTDHDHETQHGHHETHVHQGDNQQGQSSENIPHPHHHGDTPGQPHTDHHQSYGQQRFIKPMERQQPNQQFQGEEGSSSDPPSFPHLESGGVDGIVSTLSNIEREVYDGARTGAGWDSLAEPQERLVSSSSNRIPSEAFVTMCRNNAEALGCLVVGMSLLLSRTTRTLCVVVSDGVSNAFRGPLSSVFHVVQTVRSMDSLGTTKLALLEHPELGISFDKLNVWRLVQFSKCVYLNPDTLVTQNCDELFCRDELSAIPDIGWPDCFNSGVFVFVPSIQTFWQMLEFAEKRGSYDGGDQGLLNAYFKTWSDNISKKLSFIYNLMANVSYTYTPAFKQFGRNVKIVQFHGSFKPWHVKFFSRTGQISPSSAVHPTYVQFVHIWINIFRISALRQLSQEIQTYAHSQEVICAVELLRFFPLPTESESEFFLQPPSVRLRLAEVKLQRSLRVVADPNPRRKSAEFFHSTPREEEEAESPPTDTPLQKDIETPKEDVVSSTSGEGGLDSDPKEDSEKTAPEVKKKDENALPGAEVGDYMGMKAWEQGRMDYQGAASSDNIMKRLEYLMSQPK